MNFYNKRTILIFLFVTLNSCSKEIDLKAFYFQLENFEKPVVYKYENPKNSEATQYWEFSSDIKSNSLITKTYNSKFEQIELFIEKYDQFGSKLIQFEPIVYNENIESKIIENDVYKWKSNSSYSYSVEYNDNKYGKTLFSKKRHFIGFERIVIMEKSYEALKFKGIYLLDFKDLNEQYKYYQYSYYVEGMGFVRYMRYLPNGEVSELILSRISTNLSTNN